jgi:acetyltransferase
MGPHYLDRLFAPHAIAVFGASDRDGSVGNIVFRNLRQGGYQGKLYPINPKHHKVQGRKAWPDIGTIGHPIDLAVIATPAATVPDIVRQCGEAGVHAAVILSAGFGEAGDDGSRLQTQLLSHARDYGMRIVGPNCLGVMRPLSGLNATFSHNIAQPGHMALVSQSGALCTAVLDWAEGRDIGFSAMASLGDAADVDFGDVLSYLALDPHTHSILLYVEGISDARGFISGLRIAARLKPVVVVKAGRHAEGTRAALSHTGALVGGDEVFHAALRRAGAVRAYTVKQLFAAAELLASRDYQVHGNRLAIVTNGGGPGVMATDRAVEQHLAMAALGKDTLAALDGLLPAHWSHGNPVDILGDADAQRYRGAVAACLADPGVDGLLVMLTPQAMTEPLAAAEAVVAASADSNKPLLTSWMGAGKVADAHALFTAHHIPHFDTPEAAVEGFSYLASHHRNQQLLLQAPGPLGRRSEPDVQGARLVIEEALAEGRNSLSSLETHAVLHAFGVPVVRIVEAADANQALVLAETLGFPLAMKINSPDISHKSDVGGVRLNIDNAAAVRNVFRELVDGASAARPGARISGVTLEPMYRRPHGRELLVGVVRDPVFGPAISVGAGGTMVEVINDKFVSLPPLNRYIARQMIQRTRVGRLLGAFRDKPAVDMTELENVLLRVSELVCELPQVIELDINPLIVDEQGALAVDARMAVDYPAAGARDYAHMAIHPYPGQLVHREQLSDGSNITIRPIRPEDARIEADFVRNLSPESKYFRFMRALQELTPEMLVRFTQIDYDLEMALIATVEQMDQEVEVGVARYATNPDGESCEFAIVVDDRWHHKGLGVRLMRELMAAARQRGLKTMVGEALANNHHMLSLADSLGFRISNSPDDPGVRIMARAL